MRSANKKGRGKRNGCKEASVQEKRGRPLLMGDYLDEQLRAYITEIRQMGLVVNTSVLIAAAKGLVLHHDSNWLRDIWSFQSTGLREG